MWTILLITLACTSPKAVCKINDTALVNTNTSVFGQYPSKDICSQAVKSLIKSYQQDNTNIILIPQCVKVN